MALFLFPAERNRDEVYCPRDRLSRKRRHERPKPGNTMYVNGNDLEKEELEKIASKYGTIQSISMEPQKK